MASRTGFKGAISASLLSTTLTCSAVVVCLSVSVCFSQVKDGKQQEMSRGESGMARKTRALPGELVLVPLRVKH